MGRQRRRSKTLLRTQWTLTTSQSLLKRSSTSLCLHHCPSQKIRHKPLRRLICLHLLLPEGTAPIITTTVTKSDAGPLKQVPTTTKVLKESSTAAIPGVTTSLSSADQNVTLDIRWTFLYDLFLILIADSVYDARSRVLLEQVALKLGLGCLDVVEFESRVTQALEIQEGIETLEQHDIVEGARQAGRKCRYLMLGLTAIGKVFSLAISFSQLMCCL